MTGPERIAVFLPNWVGDVVMATPVLRTLRRHFPEAHLIGVMKPYVAGVLEGTAWINESIFLDKKGPWSCRWPAAAARLRRSRVDLALLLNNTLRSALAAYLGGCRRRIGYARRVRGILLTEALTPTRGPGGFQPFPAIDSYNQLVERAGCPRPVYQMELATTAVDETGADRVWQKANFSRDREVVCLNPGGAFGSAKHWPTESFARLAQRLIDERGCGILVLCGPSERDIARRIVASANRPGMFSLADEALSLGLTKACVRRADLLVTTDSGPRHFAAAFGRPVVTLFGPTHVEWTETYYAKAVHLQKKVPCGPCQLRVCPLDHRCMTTLTPDEAFAAAGELLARFPSRAA